MLWNTEIMSWKKGRYIAKAPAPRYGHTSTAIGPHLLIFGGWEQSKAQNEIIVLREFNQDNGAGLGSIQKSQDHEASQRSVNEMGEMMKDYRE